MNCITWVGANKWYDAGDERFHPDNIITDDKGTLVYIISKKTGKIVYRIGPEYQSRPELREMGPIIGPHHSHVIPKGLPGAGNIMVFDNGGAGGYGAPNPGAPTGVGNAIRYSSRVIEFNPITLKVVWEYSAASAGFVAFDDYKFFSHYVSSAQRLPNGNTLITEGADGRIFEVTCEKEVVWEYINPYFDNKDRNYNMVYRAYR